MLTLGTLALAVVAGIFVIIVTAGVPLGTPGSTNVLRIAFVGEDGSLNA